MGAYKWEFVAVFAALLAVGVLVLVALSPLAAYCDGSAHGAKWRAFWCDFKATDALIAIFTLCLVAIGTWQGIQLKRTVDSTESAGAPYVFPELQQLNLWSGTGNHVPTFNVQVWNRGKTPAIIRFARIELHIFDVLPGHAQFTQHARALLRAGEVIGAEQFRQLTYTFHRPLSATETPRLVLPTTDPEFLRFYLTVELQYDDFFGYTHTKAFCFKLMHHGGILVKRYPGFAYERKTKREPDDQEDAWA
jgi:hypothetical protein